MPTDSNLVEADPFAFGEMLPDERHRTRVRGDRAAGNVLRIGRGNMPFERHGLAFARQAENARMLTKASGENGLGLRLANERVTEVAQQLERCLTLFIVRVPGSLSLSSPGSHQRPL